jgi:DNA-directed RNA polymerase subunit K/omega
MSDAEDIEPELDDNDGELADDDYDADVVEDEREVEDDDEDDVADEDDEDEGDVIDEDESELETGAETETETGADTEAESDVDVKEPVSKKTPSPAVVERGRKAVKIEQSKIKVPPPKRTNAPTPSWGIPAFKKSDIVEDPSVHITYVDPSDRKTSHILTKYERAMVIATRASQIQKTGVYYIDNTILRLDDPVAIATRELIDRKCPINIVRKITETTAELWDVNHMFGDAT